MPWRHFKVIIIPHLNGMLLTFFLAIMINFWIRILSYCTFMKLERHFLFFKIICDPLNLYWPFLIEFVGSVLTEFRIDRMAFGQSECTCLNIQNIPLLKTTWIRSIWNSVNPVSTVNTIELTGNVQNGPRCSKLLMYLPSVGTLSQTNYPFYSASSSPLFVGLFSAAQPFVVSSSGEQFVKSFSMNFQPWGAAQRRRGC